MLITLSRLECQRESDSGVRQHVDQCIHRESVCALLREVADSRLADAKPPRGLNLREPSCLPHFAQAFHEHGPDSGACSVIDNGSRVRRLASFRRFRV